MKDPNKGLPPKVRRYGDMLRSSGMEEREVARATFYANEYGLDALTGPGCVTFDEPSCGDWNCVRPDHQRLDRTGS